MPWQVVESPVISIEVTVAGVITVAVVDITISTTVSTAALPDLNSRIEVDRVRAVHVHQPTALYRSCKEYHAIALLHGYEVRSCVHQRVARFNDGRCRELYE